MNLADVTVGGRYAYGYRERQAVVVDIGVPPTGAGNRKALIRYRRDNSTHEVWVSGRDLIRTWQDQQTVLAARDAARSASRRIIRTLGLKARLSHRSWMNATAFALTVDQTDVILRLLGQPGVNAAHPADECTPGDELMLRSGHRALLIMTGVPIGRTGRTGWWVKIGAHEHVVERSAILMSGADHDRHADAVEQLQQITSDGGHVAARDNIEPGALISCWMPHDLVLALDTRLHAEPTDVVSDLNDLLR